MRKTLAYLFLLVVVFGSCEKDDFCVLNPVTPKLILRFYDNADNTSLKSVSNLYVWAEGKDTLYANETLDSLVIPLNGNTNNTIYNFSKSDVVEQFTINYTPKNEYVSRSCGFKVTYENLEFSSSNSWIIDFTPETTNTIDNQTEAHVKIFH